MSDVHFDRYDVRLLCELDASRLLAPHEVGTILARMALTMARREFRTTVAEVVNTLTARGDFGMLEAALDVLMEDGAARLGELETDDLWPIFDAHADLVSLRHRAREALTLVRQSPSAAEMLEETEADAEAGEPRADRGHLARYAQHSPTAALSGDALDAVLSARRAYVATRGASPTTRKSRRAK